MTRTYNQDCVLAYSFDLLGERWTFLIIRELFLGPRRFGDLHAALPGIGTNLLSKRLKELEESGLVASGGEGRNQYRLSEAGEGLRPTLRELMYWAIDYFMRQPGESEAKSCIFSNDLVPDSVALAVEMFSNRSAISHPNYILHVKIDDNLYTYYYMKDQMMARRGDSSPAVARIETDVATLMQAMRGEVYIDEARRRSKISGDQAVIDHFLTRIIPGADVAHEIAEMIKAQHGEDAANAEGTSAKKASDRPVKAAAMA